MDNDPFSQHQIANIAQQWKMYEISFQSDTEYENPFYEATVRVTFTGPGGIVKNISGFWDGGNMWRVRLMPSETGSWHYKSFCSDTTNRGLHAQEGSFHCEKNPSELAIHQNGPVIRHEGEYHLRHADGTPFFWMACTAWNGTLQSTDQEWAFYLKHRSEHHFSVIQFVATQWRGCATNSQLQTAYLGRKKITVNPAFFQHLDRKMDMINAHGLVAAPVLLWSLPIGEGKRLSPGYQLSSEDAILLAKYMVARYGGHHVIWILGGDGLFVSIYEKRWKRIGREVFTEEHPGLVALHPMGKSWIGEAYANEKWLDIIGYQSGHRQDQGSVEFITKGPPARKWSKILPRPIINMEPCYEEIYQQITADEVRRASYWSVFATPVAGITYGANGIWPWIRKGEKIFNHGALGKQPSSSWRESLDLPGSKQVALLADFFRQLPWWRLHPDPSLLMEQPGDRFYDQFVSLLRSDDYHLILVYVPKLTSIKILNKRHLSYQERWFDPVNDFHFFSEKIDINEDNILTFSSPRDTDLVLILEKK